jgi:hypothetical protein
MDPVLHGPGEGEHHDAGPAQIFIKSTGTSSGATCCRACRPRRERVHPEFEGDVDESVRRAQAADETIVTEPAQQPWGYTGAFAGPHRALLDGD